MTRQDIINTAFDVWGRKMYLNTSLQDIAVELGVSTPALYRHFKSKKELIEAMFGFFFDEYAEFVREDFERAAALRGTMESMMIISRAFTRYYARRVNRLVFALTQVYGNREGGDMGKGLRERGIDLGVFSRFGDEAEAHPSAARLLMTTLIVWIGCFFKSKAQADSRCCPPPPLISPTEEEVAELERSVESIVRGGLGLDKAKASALDYEALEEAVSRKALPPEEGDNLLDAVAEAVALEGPWEASMEKVAKIAGLSKSGLYSHFRSKRDMLRKLFITEAGRILSCAGEAAGSSDLPEEQVYLGIFAAANYLRSRPQVLIAADWIRTRKIDIGPPEKDLGTAAFGGIDLTVGGRKVDFTSPDMDRYSHWVFFLIVSTLIRRPGGMDFGDLPNSSIRRLYRFIALGLKGFLDEE